MATATKPTTAPTIWRNRIVRSGPIDPAQLLANPLNWRIHPVNQREALRGAIHQVGFVDRVKVQDGTDLVLDGHLRVALALQENQPEIWCDWVDFDDIESAFYLATVDPIAAMAGMDADNFAALMAQVSTDDEAVQALLDELSGVPAITTGLTDPDDVPAIPDEPITKPGDLWLLGRHRLLCGDATVVADVERLMGGERARLVVTSPPYNQNIETFKPSGMQKESPAFVHRMSGAYYDSMPEDEYRLDQIQLLELLKGFMTPDGSIFYNHKIRYRDKRAISPMEWLSQLSYPVRQEIVWDRGSSITLNARMFVPADERIYWLRVGDEFVFNDDIEIKSWSSVWDVAAVNDVKASAAFATEIPRRCIRACSESGDIVLDPYSGSGTTIIAAHEQERIGYGLEIDPHYCDVIVARWSQFTGQTAQLATEAMAAD